MCPEDVYLGGEAVEPEEALRAAILDPNRYFNCRQL